MNRRDFLIVSLCLAFTSSARAGAWGVGSFDNDDALDWIRQCVRSPDSQLVYSALNTALKGGYLEAPEGSAAIAAAEAVAAALGHPSSKLPKELATWVTSQQKETLTKFAPLARKAVTRVLRAPQSELRDLWKDSKDLAAWESAVSELLARLKGRL